MKLKCFYRDYGGDDDDDDAVWTYWNFLVPVFSYDGNRL